MDKFVLYVTLLFLNVQVAHRTEQFATLVVKVFILTLQVIHVKLVEM
jgi:hypothetical protein